MRTEFWDRHGVMQISGCHSFTRLRSTLINMQIIKPHLHSLIGTHVPRIFYRPQRRGDV